MSKKVKLLNTAVKKPDGTWLGGTAFGIGDGGGNDGYVLADTIISSQNSKIKNRTLYQGGIDPNTGAYNKTDLTSIRTGTYAYTTSITYACTPNYKMRVFVYNDAESQGSPPDGFVVVYNGNHSIWSRVVTQPAYKYCRIEIKKADGGNISKDDFRNQLYELNEVKSINGETGEVVLNGQQSLVDDIRYYDGEMAKWHMTRYQDRLYRSDMSVSITSGKTYKSVLTEFPVDSIQSFSAVSDTGVVLGVKSRANADYNGGVLTFDLHSISAPSEDYHMLTSFTATRKSPPKEVDWSNKRDENGVARINPKTGNTYSYDAVNLASSYYNADYIGRTAKDEADSQNTKSLMAYGNNWSFAIKENFLVDEDGCRPMVCSTLVLMVLLGIHYEKSPYADTEYINQYQADHPDENVVRFPREDIKNYFDNKYWHINWFNYDASAQTFKNAIAKFPGHTAISWSSEETWDFWRRGWLFTARDSSGNFKPDLVEDGDIIFFRSPQGNSREFTSNYDNVSHVGVCAKEAKIVNGEVTDQEELVIYHVTSSGKIHDPELCAEDEDETRKLVAHRTPWEDYMRYIPAYASDRNDFYFGRPKYWELVGDGDDM